MCFNIYASGYGTLSIQNVRLLQNSLKFNLRAISQQEREILSLEKKNRMTSENFAFDSSLGMLLFFCLCYKYSFTSSVMKETSYLWRAVVARWLTGPSPASANFRRSGMPSGSRAFFRANRYIMVSSFFSALSSPPRINFLASTTA